MDRNRSQAKSPREHPKARRQHKPALSAEVLEDRQLLAVLFTPHGGPVLKNVQVYTVYWDWTDPSFGNPNVAGTLAKKLQTLEGQINDFFADITGSGYMAGLAQYTAGKGTFAAQDVVPQIEGTPTVLPPKGPITTLNIENMLTFEINATILPAFTGNQLYFVFTPPTYLDQVVRPNGRAVVTSGSTSALGFFGFHAWNQAKGYPYAVIPFPDLATDVKKLIVNAKLKPRSVGASNLPLAQTALNAITGASSHELVEGITDPEAYYTNAGNVATGWWFGSPGYEIGDPPGINGVFFTYPVEAGFKGGPYVVQGYYSNFIQISNQPHVWPLVGGNPQLPGFVNLANAVGRRPPVNFLPNPPGAAKPPRPNQPAPPNLPAPAPPAPPVHAGPAIPGGGSLVQPVIASSSFNPNDLALASQNGLVISTNDGASWSHTIAFPTVSSGDSSLVYDKKGNLYWSYLNPVTGGITIVTLNPSTGAVVAGPFTVDAPASGFTDVQQVLAADFSTGNPNSNNLAIVWSQLGPAGSSEILLSLSTNQGKTWLAPVTVAASSGTPPAYEYGATVTFAPNGSIVVAHHAQPGYTVANDGGIVPDGLSGQTLVAIYAFNGTTLIQDGSTITAFAAGQSDITFNDQAGSRTIAGTKFLTQGSAIPQILADPSLPGTLYVVTVQDPSAGTANPPSSELVIATLTQNPDGSWSAATSTIAPPSSSSTFQLFPTATIDTSGDIVVSWYTNASGLTNASGNYLLDTDATYSVDGGQTWATPFAVDNQAFDPDAGAAAVLGGPPPTTGIGNSFGVTIDGATVFVANDTNTYTGSTATGQQVAVESFVMPGTLHIPTSLGNNTITISQQASASGVDVVQINGVTVFVGSLASISGGIRIGNPGAEDETASVSPNVENDTLILNYANGDPVPSAGITFDAAEGGTNTVEVNADANYSLSNSSLSMSGNSVSGTDTITLDDVTAAQLTGGPSNDAFTLDAWSGSTTITGGTGSNTLLVAAGSVQTSTLSVSHVQTMELAPTVGTIFTAAGNGSFDYKGDGGAATAAALFDPTSVAVDIHGDLFIADSGNNVIREVTSNGIITTVAGTGTAGYTGNGGPATSAELDDPTGVAVDSSGDLFIADSGNNVIREVTPSGIITTVAGTGTGGYSGDGGTATSAQLNDPTGIALDSSGDLFIADSGNNVIREVTGGTIGTVAGNGTAGYTGDGSAATAAELNLPQGVAVDSSGDLFIADTGNNVIREVTSGTISTIAGTGTAGYTGDGGAATVAELDLPQGVAVGSSGNLYIADTGNNVIREVVSGTISTVAGTGTAGYSGDGGPASAATLSDPTAVAQNAQGGVVIADAGNNVVRQVTGASLDVNASFGSIPTIEAQSGGVLELDNGVTLTATVANAGTLVLGNGTTTAHATIAGNYSQTETGILAVKLGGTAAGQYDSLDVTGNIALDGTLDVSLVGGFVPTAGDSFQIITYMGALTGDFTTKNFPSLGSGNKFTSSSGSGSYTLSVTT